MTSFCFLSIRVGAMFLSLSIPAAASYALETSPIPSPTCTAPHPHREFHAHPDWPLPSSETSTIPGLVKAFYDAISAAAGQHLDRTRLRSLFTPDGRIAYVDTTSDSGHSDVVFLTPDQYADGYERAPDPKRPDDGFYDHEIANHIERFGDMAHVWGAYQSSRTPEANKPFVRGIKSMDLLYREGHWYILQVYFARETPSVPIPEEFLRG